MKGRSLSTKLIFVFLFFAVAAYFAVQGYRYLLNPLTTSLVYAYETDESITATGFFVRDEQAIEEGETLLEIERTEGERVPSDGLLATVYESEEALAAQKELRALRSKLEQLQYARAAARDTESALKLDGDIRKELTALHASLAAGEFSEAEEHGDALAEGLLKREYTYEDKEVLSERADRLRAEIDALSGRLGGALRRIRAPFAGTYSALVDGYEGVLTPARLETMSVADYRALSPDQSRSTVGKLIRGEDWRFVTVLPKADAARLREGQSLLLRAGTGVEFDLSVSVERIGKDEQGSSVVVLRGGSHIAHVTLLREQSAEIVLRSFEGLRIPKNALRIDGDGKTGVYCRVGLNAYFKPVEVVWQAEDFFLVRPVPIESTSEQQLLLYTLRVNDEAIVSSEELYDGKVVG